MIKRRKFLEAIVKGGGLLLSILVGQKLKPEPEIAIEAIRKTSQGGYLVPPEHAHFLKRLAKDGTIVHKTNFGCVDIDLVTDDKDLGGYIFPNVEQEYIDQIWAASIRKDTGFVGRVMSREPDWNGHHRSFSDFIGKTEDNL